MVWANITGRAEGLIQATGSKIVWKDTESWKTSTVQFMTGIL